MPAQRTSVTGRTELDRDFFSWSEFVSSAADQSLKQWRRICASHEYGSGGWAGTKTFAEAIDMAQVHGWPEGRELMAQSLAIVAPRPHPYRTQTFDVAGAYPLVPMYLTGDPACMMDLGDQAVAAKPIVRIDYNSACSAYIQSKSIMLRGAAVLSLCQQLEERGYSVQIRIIQNTSAGKYAFRVSTVFKQAGQPLDLDRAAFALAHPATLRRLFFAIMEQHGELENIFGSGYGRPMHEPNDPRHDTIYISGPQDQETPQSAREAVATAAKEYLK